MEKSKQELDPALTFDNMLARINTFHHRWYASTAQRSQVDKLLRSEEFRDYEAKLIMKFVRTEGATFLTLRRDDLNDLLWKIAEVKVMLADARFQLARASFERLLEK